ncbi:MAG: hypothetical protein ACRCXZ_00735 [Patescibacteria group bacterium]
MSESKVVIMFLPNFTKDSILLSHSIINNKLTFIRYFTHNKRINYNSDTHSLEQFCNLFWIDNFGY